VTVDILIDEEGNVADTNVTSSPGEAFSKAAVTCVKKWKFRPGTANGEPRSFRQTVTIDFRLKSTPPPTPKPR
jgi:protein TonB